MLCKKKIKSWKFMPPLLVAKKTLRHGYFLIPFWPFGELALFDSKSDSPRNSSLLLFDV